MSLEIIGGVERAGLRSLENIGRVETACFGV